MGLPHPAYLMGERRGGGSNSVAAPHSLVRRKLMSSEFYAKETLLRFLWSREGGKEEEGGEGE